MDFGVYQLYESNEVFHTQLDNYAEMDEIQFVYSPTHMEEVCRMDNSIFEGKRRDNISKICSNCEVFLVRDGCLKILTEPVEVCFDRAKKLQVLNQYAEESECATFEALEEKTCGLLRWDEKEVETHRKEISLLTSTQLFDPKNEMIDNESINRVFYEICGSRFPVALYDNDSAGLSEIKVLKNIPIPSNVRIMHLPDLEMCLHYPSLRKQLMNNPG